MVEHRARLQGLEVRHPPTRFLRDERLLFCWNAILTVRANSELLMTEKCAIIRYKIGFYKCWCNICCSKNISIQIIILYYIFVKGLQHFLKRTYILIYCILFYSQSLTGHVSRSGGFYKKLSFFVRTKRKLRLYLQHRKTGIYAVTGKIFRIIVRIPPSLPWKFIP